MFSALVEWVHGKDFSDKALLIIWNVLRDCLVVLLCLDSELTWWLHSDSCLKKAYQSCFNFIWSRSYNNTSKTNYSNSFCWQCNIFWRIIGPHLRLSYKWKTKIFTVSKVSSMMFSQPLLGSKVGDEGKNDSRIKCLLLRMNFLPVIQAILINNNVIMSSLYSWDVFSLI